MEVLSGSSSSLVPVCLRSVVRHVHCRDQETCELTVLHRTSGCDVWKGRTLSNTFFGVSALEFAFIIDDSECPH